MVGPSNMAAIGFTYAQQMRYPVPWISNPWFQYRSDINNLMFRIQNSIPGSRSWIWHSRLEDTHNIIWEKLKAKWLHQTELYITRPNLDYVHTMPKQFENGADKSEFAVAFTLRRSEIIWKHHFWARFLYKRTRWKRSDWRFRVNTNSTTFLYSFAKQNIKFEIALKSNVFALIEIFERRSLTFPNLAVRDVRWRKWCMLLNSIYRNFNCILLS